jgi:ATP-binding protein involved in chromosome partitioning
LPKGDEIGLNKFFGLPKIKLEGVKRLIAVASGKGGVGKTTVAVNLSLALGRLGARVGLFDADLYGPNVPLMLGVRRKESARGFIPVARASREPYIPPLERYGLKTMSIGLVMGEKTPIIPDSVLAGEVIRQTLRDVLWGELDYLLIDLPPGTGEPQQTLLKSIQVDAALIVTTPQDLSLLDAGRSLGLFQQAGVAILGVVENMSYLHCPHCGETIEVFHHSRRDWAIAGQEIEVLGRIPMDIAISRGIHAGHPLVQAVPEGREAKVFLEIASRMVQIFGD